MSEILFKGRFDIKKNFILQTNSTISLQNKQRARTCIGETQNDLQIWQTIYGISEKTLNLRIINAKDLHYYISNYFSYHYNFFAICVLSGLNTGELI